MQYVWALLRHGTGGEVSRYPGSQMLTSAFPGHCEVASGDLRLTGGEGLPMTREDLNSRIKGQGQSPQATDTHLLR